MKSSKNNFLSGLFFGFFVASILIPIFTFVITRLSETNSWYHFLYNNPYSIYDSEIISENKKTIKVRYINQYKSGKYFFAPHILDKILKEKYNVKYVTDNSYDLIIDGTQNREKVTLKQEAVKFYFSSEYNAIPALGKIEDYDLIIGASYNSGKNYVRLPFAYSETWPTFNPTDISTSYNREARQGNCNPKKKHFACTLLTNYSWNDAAERVRLFHLLSLYKNVLSGGSVLNNNGVRDHLGSRDSLALVPYENTSEWISQCKFMISYENNFRVEGYITEKPYQAYFSGSIPLYMSNKTALDEINKNALIYQGDFSSQEEMVEYIKKVDNDDDLYCKIWNQNIINNEEYSYNAVYKKFQERVYQVLNEKFQ